MYAVINQSVSEIVNKPAGQSMSVNQLKYPINQPTSQ